MIPILKPALPSFDDIKEELRECFNTGMLIMGKNVRKFEEKAAKYFGVKHAITTSSGSIGLIITLSTLPKGSEVIMPSFTFSATAQAAVWNDLKPVLVDCDEFCNIDPIKVKAAITDNTSAILGVHMFGTPCKIEELDQIAKDHNIKLFYDSAHAFGSEYKGKKIGQFGDAEIFSLGVTKAFATGEGCLITTDDDDLATYLRLAANNGRAAGSIDPSVLGLSGRFQEFNAIVALHNLRVIDEHVDKRNEKAKLYRERLQKIEGIRICPVPEGIKTTLKDFAVFIDEEKFGMSRNDLADYLTKKEIQIKYYFDPPIHKIKFFKDDFKDIQLPITDKLSSTTISLPFYTSIPEEEIEYVCKCIEEAQKSD